MSELLVERLKTSVGKSIIIFLHNNFRFEGKLLNTDNRFIELLDFKSGKIKVVDISEIKELEVAQNG